MRTGEILLAFACSFALVATSRAQVVGPDTVHVESGSLELSALLWRPAGPGPFPAVLFNHGSPRPATTELGRLDRENHARLAAALGPLFARHGYVLLFLYRRGCGLSAAQGSCSGDLMARESALHGDEGWNRIQLELLETVELEDALAGLAFLRALPEVDSRRLAVVGHSFGGSLALLVAERDSAVGAVVDFAGAAGSWERSPPLRERLFGAVRRASAPVFFVFAENDYSIAPARELAEEMQAHRKAHRVAIYPAVGATAEEGHALALLAVETWEPDVFEFLDENLRR
jgi:dienelactone hydrolase